MAKTVAVECEILDIQPIPNTLMQLVSIKFKLGEREWTRAFRLAYDRPISMEEFKRDLASKEIIPSDPDDFLAFVKEEVGKKFTLEIERDLEQPAAG